MGPAIEEYDAVVLCENLPKLGLRRGMIGVVVHVYGPGWYEVEFLDVQTHAVIGLHTMTSEQIRLHQEANGETT